MSQENLHKQYSGPVTTDKGNINIASSEVEYRPILNKLPAVQAIDIIRLTAKMTSNTSTTKHRNENQTPLEPNRQVDVAYPKYCRIISPTFRKSVPIRAADIHRLNPSEEPEGRPKPAPKLQYCRNIDTHHAHKMASYCTTEITLSREFSSSVR